MLDKHNIPVLVIDHADLRKFPNDVIRKICEFWDIPALNPDLLSTTLQRPKGCTNVTPVNQTGIKLLRAENYVRSLLGKGVSMGTFNRVEFNCKNRVFRDKVVQISNRLGRDDMLKIEIPDVWGKRFSYDWNMSCNRVFRIENEQ
jgi:hypothetical protein